ncbi:hypothetical protein SAMN04487969_101871 [Paenibacillus algorifonticola]|uniref:DUF4259 domain-containing protein n=1 Tax=Paenibacillus algorifonticola TaxID=684063 RepID=A0A1I1Z1L7_9BACL|nr:hypothetical protein [Paenibacillus algorifonticola]SFE24323.1 hypothetical protein SAMN04487969_101871 [Paenibacillus algorifonticola]
MGTWSAEVFGNDTSCEIKEYFYEQYNRGSEVTEIVSELQEKFTYSLNSTDDRNNVLFALSYCLWETKCLEDSLLEQVAQIIESGSDLTVCEQLGANVPFINQRKKYLHTFIAKISVPKSIAKKRVKPPTQFESDYHNGSCLTFQYPSGLYGGIIIIDCAFYRNRGSMRIAFTDIEQHSEPDYNDFLASRLTNFSWEGVWGEANKYAAFEGKTARISTYPLSYDHAKERASYFEYNDKFFTIVGELPKYTQCLLATVGIGVHYNLAYPEFAISMKKTLLYWKQNEDLYRKKVSKETITKLNNLLVLNK